MPNDALQPTTPPMGLDEGSHGVLLLVARVLCAPALVAASWWPAPPARARRLGALLAAIGRGYVALQLLHQLAQLAAGRLLPVDGPARGGWAFAACSLAAGAACAVLAAQTPAPAAGVRPGPTRGDPRDGSVPIAASDSTRRDSVPAFIADTTVRRGVAERFPDALRGGMGRRPFLWILADAQDRVLGTATGRQGLSRNKFGQEGLDWEAARRKFPEQLPPAMTRDDRAQWNAVAIAGADTAQVIWIRVARPVAPR